MILKLRKKPDLHVNAAWETFQTMRDLEDFVDTMKIICEIKEEKEDEEAKQNDDDDESDSQSEDGNNSSSDGGGFFKM
jgi:hypothetical protein